MLFINKSLTSYGCTRYPLFLFNHKPLAFVFLLKITPPQTIQDITLRRNAWHKLIIKKEMSLLSLHNYSAKHPIPIVTLTDYIFSTSPNSYSPCSKVVSLHVWFKTNHPHLLCGSISHRRHIFLLFYENNYLPPQRGFYIITSIDAEKFKSPRNILRKKNGTKNLLQKIKSQLFRKVTKLL